MVAWAKAPDDAIYVDTLARAFAHAAMRLPRSDPRGHGALESHRLDA
jgi:hypothetical protein